MKSTPFAIVCITLGLAACGDTSGQEGSSPPRGRAPEILQRYDEGDDGDALVLKHMKEAGADLGKATDVRWYVYFPVESDAKSFADLARADGWTVELSQGDGDDAWVAVCNREAVLSLEVIRSMQAQFEVWGKGLNANVDGWEAAITK